MGTGVEGEGNKMGVGREDREVEREGSEVVIGNGRGRGK